MISQLINQLINHFNMFDAHPPISPPQNLQISRLKGGQETAGYLNSCWIWLTKYGISVVSLLFLLVIPHWLYESVPSGSTFATGPSTPSQCLGLFPVPQLEAL